MGFNLAQSDISILDNISIEIDSGGREPVDGFVNGITDIPIQFPPMIRSDNKTAMWTNGETTKGSYEPLGVVLIGADARRVSMVLTYVITGSKVTAGRNSYTYDVQGVSDIAHMFRSVLYYKIPEQPTTIPVLKIRMYGNMPGGEVSTWRVQLVNITHDGPIIQSGSPLVAGHHLKTEVMLDLSLITRAGMNTDGRLPSKPLQQWY